MRNKRILKKLGEVLRYEQPTKYIVNSNKYRDEYSVPVLTAGKTFILGYTDEKNGIFPEEKLPVIIFDDFTTAIKFVNFPFKVKSSAMKILHPNGLVDAKFLFYLMQTLKFKADQHKRYWISEYSNIEVALPPIEEQNIVVSKIDKIFTKISDTEKLYSESLLEAKAILASTLNQYFANTNDNKAKLKDVTLLERGKFTPRPRNDPRYFGGNIPWIQIGDITNKQGKYITSYSGTLNEEGLAVSRMFSAGTVVTSIAASIGTTGILNFDSAFPDSLIGIQGKEVLNDYVYYYLLYMQSHLNQIAPQVAQKNINLKILGDLDIPTPNLENQKEIIRNLDNLNEKMQILQNLQKKQLLELGLLKQSILNQAFQRELTI